MATLTAQIIARAGLTPSFAAAAGGGDQFYNQGNQYLEVVNGGGGAITVTIATQSTVDGEAVADKTVSVTNGQSRKIGPFPPSIYNDSNDNIQITYSGVTSVTVGVFSL